VNTAYTCIHMHTCVGPACKQEPCEQEMSIKRALHDVQLIYHHPPPPTCAHAWPGDSACGRPPAPPAAAEAGWWTTPQLRLKSQDRSVAMSPMQAAQVPRSSPGGRRWRE
jgi:hypothetical protein